MSELPPPLVSPEVNLSTHEWYKVYPDRVRKSRWWRRASHLARSVNFILWGEAWQSIPAGSLPDDDDELAEAAGFGFDTAAFQAVKAEIMEPWTLCSDGRWYHPTVCEQVLAVWEALGERRRMGAVRQARYKARTRGTAPLTPSTPKVTRQQAGITRQSGVEEKRGEEKLTVGSASPAMGQKAWEKDKAFALLWSITPPPMKKRSSRKKAWAPYRQVVQDLPFSKLLAALRAYLDGDEDFKRTGGPGLHLWLADHRFEAWLVETVPPLNRDETFWRVAVRLFRETGRWSDDLGPKPGEPGCNVPPALLLEAVA